jgi:hypothetical protein
LKAPFSNNNLLRNQGSDPWALAPSGQAPAFEELYELAPFQPIELHAVAYQL